jgi:oligopeptide transport system substrate-binding protein
MEFLQAQWRENLGIRVKLTGLEWESYLARLDEQPFTIYRLGWCQDYPHPNNFLRDVFYTGSGNNESRYSNPDFDKLVDEAAVKPTLEEQLPLYAQAQDILVDDAPALFLYWYGRFTLIKPWVQGLVATAGDSTTGEYFYDRVSISGKES